MTSAYPRVRIAIDRGGTFTDVYAEVDYQGTDGTKSIYTQRHVLKLLSEDPHNYDDAPTEAIRRILHLATGTEQPRGQPLETTYVQSIRMGTTIATNALLERKGEPCALVVTEGLGDILQIGNQARPNIFDLKVQKKPPLTQLSIEARERVILDKQDNAYQRGLGEAQAPVKIRQALDEEYLCAQLECLKAKSVQSIAIALMHSYILKDHETRIRQIAIENGFKHISLSSELTPMVKIVPRAFTATVDAYLTPKIKQYIEKFRSGFRDCLKHVEVQFMQSDGGLCDIDSFSGYLAILSGPAGGVVGYAKSFYGYERNFPENGSSTDVQPVIGFDMGGTSTDVSRYSGHFDHVFETETAGVTIQAPQLDINTVAAGGGSRLFFRNGMFYVGPESAGAHPGPVCYRKGGYLTITDANLLLGRIEPSLFPHIFGEDADQPLDITATRKAFAELTEVINDSLRAMNEGEMVPEQVAEGFIKVANETMCRPIRQLTEAKGFDTRYHSLACFGGAGGQHACAIARSLGIETVYVHKYSGVLSAYGTALADSVVEVQEPADVMYINEGARKKAFIMLKSLRSKAQEVLRKRGFKEETMRFELYIDLRYAGTDFGIMVQCPEEYEHCPERVEFDNLFEEKYHLEHGFSIPERPLVIDNVRVRGLGNLNEAHNTNGATSISVPRLKLNTETQSYKKTVEGAVPVMTTRCFYSDAGGWVSSEVWRMEDLPKGKAVLPGPCLIIDMAAGNTIVIDPGSIARVACDSNVIITIQPVVGSSKTFTRSNVDIDQVDPVKLSIYSHRFMSIAEQMGRTLQRTSISTNIKERLDFSCALFDETGGLVANAPHVPVHLGSMQDTVRYQIRSLRQSWVEGEVVLSNHPQAGGSHLPDITIITPVFNNKEVVFYVASRGHHADIGGKTPGSMPPFSKKLSDEGLAVRSMRIVKSGLFQEDEITGLLREAGCRCIQDVISDIRAQIAANKKGIVLVRELIEAEGLHSVQLYMHHIQVTAERAVRCLLKKVSLRKGLGEHPELQFSDHMDDGTEIKLTIRINPKLGTALFDFSGTGPESTANTNAPLAITTSAVIYALRCLVDEDIPLNQGCLNPIKIIVPKNSILSPSDGAAVVGGNVLTSQRVTDVIFGAFGACAASQGCMNNLTFGDETMGYYETIGGGAGAGPGWDGASGVQSHMTNTRITDPEIIERRYPVIVREFSLRKNSQGTGRHNGGNGLIRSLEFTKAMIVSILSERRTYSPWGCEGGGDAEPGKNLLIKANGSVLNLGGKNSVEVVSGDVVQVQTPGGGAFGKIGA
ncbi:5-oxoprolinase [Gracilariopsis chorda]|uniref:5-oxoprolinase n=1 Tax=Gracilariopsis chorda TaxID=448386 RepID=A0A2V3J1H8_9FLOR|nr:5-oxoprolinase [Gracilariopsis chorda]|eukprot:PXF48199.1 5-oxoprolinase [Gracilariopsis chorda]